LAGTILPHMRELVGTAKSDGGIIAAALTRIEAEHLAETKRVGEQTGSSGGPERLAR
jgi:hypothetical protein